MPLAVLLWILVILPAAWIVWLVIAMMTEMDGDHAGPPLVIIGALLILAAPNLLWYGTVRDVMKGGSGVPVEKLDKPLTVEKAP